MSGTLLVQAEQIVDSEQFPAGGLHDIVTRLSADPRPAALALIAGSRARLKLVVILTEEAYDL